MTHIKKVQPYFICALAILFYLYDYVIQVSPSVMTHDLRRDFHVNATGMGILGSCFFYAYLLMQPVSGYLLDRFGARLLLTCSALMMGLGTVLFSLSPTILAAGASRFIIGLGASCAFITAVYLVSRWLSAKYFTFNTGIIQLGACIGAIFGAAPIAIFVNGYGWRHTMLVVGVITWVLALIFWVFIRNKEVNAPHVEKPEVTPWKNFKTVMSNGRVWWIAIASMAAWFPVSAIASLWGVPYMMEAYGWTNVEAGYVIILFWIAVGLGSPIIGMISTLTGNRVGILAVCFGIGVIGTLMFTFGTGHGPVIIYIALLCIGILSSVEGIIFSILKDTVPAHTFGTASGFTNTIVIIGSTIAQPIIGKCLDLGWHGAMAGGIRHYSLSDYQHAMIIVPVIAIVGMLAVVFKVRSKR